MVHSGPSGFHENPSGTGQYPSPVLVPHWIPQSNVNTLLIPRKHSRTHPSQDEELVKRDRATSSSGTSIRRVIQLFKLFLRPHPLLTVALLVPLHSFGTNRVSVGADLEIGEQGASGPEILSREAERVRHARKHDLFVDEQVRTSILDRLR
jgi:hypothetical protein